MNCPYCLNAESKVTNKRGSPNGIRRRRECLKCSKRFTTYERMEPIEIYVVKKDGRKEKFERSKLEQGIIKAFEKRPVPKEDIEMMIINIEGQLKKMGSEIKSSVIGETIMKRLEKMDKVAYVRFASVYKDFQNMKDFRSIIKNG
jgi:transcriptional repressor NrdR